MQTLYPYCLPPGVPQGGAVFEPTTTTTFHTPVCGTALAAAGLPQGGAAVAGPTRPGFCGEPTGFTGNCGEPTAVTWCGEPTGFVGVCGGQTAWCGEPTGFVGICPPTRFGICPQAGVPQDAIVPSMICHSLGCVQGPGQTTICHTLTSIPGCGQGAGLPQGGGFPIGQTGWRGCTITAVCGNTIATNFPGCGHTHLLGCGTVTVGQTHLLGCGTVTLPHTRALGCVSLACAVGGGTGALPQGGANPQATFTPVGCNITVASLCTPVCGQAAGLPQAGTGAGGQPPVFMPTPTALPTRIETVCMHTQPPACFLPTPTAVPTRIETFCPQTQPPACFLTTATALPTRIETVCVQTQPPACFLPTPTALPTRIETVCLHTRIETVCVHTHVPACPVTLPHTFIGCPLPTQFCPTRIETVCIPHNTFAGCFPTHACPSLACGPETVTAPLPQGGGNAFAAGGAGIQSAGCPVHHTLINSPCQIGPVTANIWACPILPPTFFGTGPVITLVTFSGCPPHLTLGINCQIQPITSRACPPPPPFSWVCGPGPVIPPQQGGGAALQGTVGPVQCNVTIFSICTPICGQ